MTLSSGLLPKGSETGHMVRARLDDQASGDWMDWSAYIPATSYFVNAEPASLREAGPSAT